MKMYAKSFRVDALLIEAYKQHTGAQVHVYTIYGNHLFKSWFCQLLREQTDYPIDNLTKITVGQGKIDAETAETALTLALVPCLCLDTYIVALAEKQIHEDWVEVDYSIPPGGELGDWLFKIEDLFDQLPTPTCLKPGNKPRRP